MAAEDDYRELARQIISKAIETATTYIFTGMYLEDENEIDPVADCWPIGSATNDQTGAAAIEAFINGWDRGSEWKYFIKCFGQSGDKLEYEVCWSIPTRRKPIPRATASVYFTLWTRSQVEKVAVFYVFEGQRLVHRPGQPQFREVWLKNIIDSKMKVLETLGNRYSNVNTLMST